MNRLFDYYNRYIGVTREALSFLESYGEVCHYARGEFFMRPETRMPYWCMMLEGLTFGYTLYPRGERRIHWFAFPMQGFTGVRHLYTPAKLGLYIEFMEHSSLYRIAALRMREAKERFPEISELLHIYKQQQLNRYAQIERILHRSSAYDRFALFRETFPDIARLVSPQHQADFINVSRSQFFEVQRQWLRSGGGVDSP